MASHENHTEDAEHDDGDAESVPSRHSSITHPYRGLFKDTSFPRCHLVTTPNGKTETLVRSLFPLGHGFPLWNPVGESGRRDGIAIGDVGIVTLDGFFRYYFNIFLPVADPVQCQVPPDFEPLLPPPTSSEIFENHQHFPPGTALVSQGVSVSRLSESPLNLLFKTQAREAGVVVLPDGASREDLASTSRISEYVARHALSWYLFINEGLHDLHPNGSLYIVTGCDKAKSWGIASSPRSETRAGDEMTARYDHSQAHPWQDVDGVVTRSKHLVDSSIQRCAIFIRGLKVALNPRSWAKHLLENKPPLTIPYFNLLSTPIIGYRARRLTQRERRQGCPPRYLPNQDNLIFHPLDIVLQILLDESSESKVAVVGDSTLSFIGNKRDVPLTGTLADTIKLLARILDLHTMHADDGLVTLVPKVEQAGPLNLKKIFLYIPHLIKITLKSSLQHRRNLRRIAKFLPGTEPVEVKF